MGDPAMRVVLIGWPPGFATIPHHHPYGPETFEVIEGTLGFRLDDTIPKSRLPLAHSCWLGADRSTACASWVMARS